MHKKMYVKEMEQQMLPYQQAKHDKINGER